MSFIGSRFQVRRFALVACVAIVALSASGCTLSVEVLQRAEPTPRPVATVAPAGHALSILAIDFDPPLGDVEVLAEGGVTLLVAVENQGLSAEQDVVVTARLVDASAEGVQRELLSETVTVPLIESGELKIVRFEQVSGVPLRDSYVLLIEAPPVPGEAVSADNVRRYDVIVHAGD
jgi:hypothetical protein